MKKDFLAAASSLLPSLAIAASLALLPSAVRASDHGDAPSIDHDSGADIADQYLFLDPNDNTKLILIMTVHGFIVPGEANNFATFDPKVKFEFKVSNSGVAKPDMTIKLQFSEKTAPTAPQMATIKFSNGLKLTAPTTPSTVAATPNTPVITTDQASGVSFFAGERDDPFFFDLVAFNRFIASVTAGAPDATVFQRGRDTFAGYNVLAMELSVPVSLLKGTGNTVGIESVTKRETQSPSPAGGYDEDAPFVQVDRAGLPAINVALIPYAQKDAYNAATPQDDAKGKFASSIVATLTTLGTDSAHISALAGLAVTNGDYLRVDVTQPNSGAGGGTVSTGAFPNGRRPSDDVIDTILTVIHNGSPLGDNVNANDVAFLDTFPFLAPPHQPQDTGVVDDNTRN